MAGRWSGLSEGVDRHRRGTARPSSTDDATTTLAVHTGGAAHAGDGPTQTRVGGTLSGMGEQVLRTCDDCATVLKPSSEDRCPACGSTNIRSEALLKFTLEVQPGIPVNVSVANAPGPGKRPRRVSRSSMSFTATRAGSNRCIGRSAKPTTSTSKGLRT
jgi:hypothetical protein